MKKNKNRSLLTVIVILAVLQVVPFNAAYGKKFPLSKQNAEFLSAVRYIITKDETRYFRHLPDSKRQEFIRLFWDIRDPIPGTVENEFKLEYFKRIEEANLKFTAAREGWLTDRGKTYVMLGPPRYVADYPTGVLGERSFTRPFVVWHYAEVFLLFEQNKNDGDYEVQYVSMYQHSLVQRAFAEAKQQYKVLENLFKYTFKYKKIAKVPHLIFTIDTAKLNFKKENDRMVSNLEISVTARDKNYNESFKYRKIHPISFDKDAAGSSIPKKTSIKVPLKLSKGQYFVFTAVKLMDEQHSTFYNKLLKIK
jgi:GWxTD domain-containing protein